MADNVAITAGSGTTVATDDVAGVHYQIVKISTGALDAAGSPVSSANPMPVTATCAGDVAHGTADSGSPLKTGYKARNAFPTAEANGDRVDASSDLFGRGLTAHIDPAQYVWKSFNATSAQTGIDVWSPASGKKIAVTHLVLSVYGTTAGRVLLWFGANADTTYSAGTDQLLLAASFAPSTTAKAGLVLALPHPVFCVTADYELHITTDAAMSVDVAVGGYEW